MSVTCMSRAQRGVNTGDTDFSSIDMCLKMVGNDKFSETRVGKKVKRARPKEHQH